MKREEFIERAIKTHGNKYDYSKVEYINNRTKVCIICPEHGEFWQIPYHHLKGNGCKKCANYNLWEEKRKKIDFIEFKKRVIEKFGNIYDFSKTKYVNTHTKIIIGYNGKFFETIPAKLMSNSQKKPIKHDFIENTEDFIKKSKSIYGNKYDYSKVNYINSREKVCIICKKHGEFFQSPNDHVNGCQCPKCVNSNLENELKLFLINNNIEFIEQYSPSFLNEKFSHQKYDFFLPKFNIAIECQGKQHFYPVEIFGGKIALNENKNRDCKKNIKSNLNGINILYYIDSHIKLSKILNNNEYNSIYTKENTFKNKKKLLNKIFSFK